MPDIVISIGGNYIFNNELKNFFRQGTIENWRVGLEDKERIGYGILAMTI